MSKIATSKVEFNQNIYVERVLFMLIAHKLNVRGSLNKFPDFFRMGTFIDSTHIKLYSPSKYSPQTAMHLLYRFNNFWKAPWKFSCVSVSLTFVTASFISSIVITTAYELRE